MHKNERTKLTIITVALNDAKGLDKTIKSVISQTYNEYEYIVIDGGSTDGTVDVINSHKDIIDYWVSEPDDGIYNAMNKGIRVSHGDWLIFMNSGDTFTNCYVLERMAPFLSNSQYKVVYGKIIHVYGNRKEIGENIVKRKKPDVVDFVIKTIPHQAAFIKRDMFDKYGLYDEHFKLAADQIFFMKVIGLHQEMCKYVNEIICNFMMDGSNVKYRDLCREEKKKAFEEEFGNCYSYLRELAEYRNSSILRSLLKIRMKLKSIGVVSLFRKIIYAKKL